MLVHFTGVLRFKRLRCARLKRLFSGKSEYDLVVIGGGPAGYVASIKAAQLGLKTACVEGRGTLGGTCLNVGCIPSKTMLHNSHLYKLACSEFAKRGINVSNVSLNLAQMMKAKDDSVKSLTMGISGLFRKNKVDWIKGWAEILSPSEVRTKDSASLRDSGSIIKSKYIIIATGSESVGFPNVERSEGVDIDEKQIVTSTGALSLSEVPKEMLVLGGGIIGLELGTLWNNLGAKVTVVEYLDRIGGSMDSSIMSSFKKIIVSQGIDLRTSTKVTKVMRKDGRLDVHMEGVSSGERAQASPDVLLICVGRKPYTKNLGLENVGIETLQGGQIKVDDSFTTSVPNIKAIGDVIRGPMLAHKAEEEGISAVEHIVHNYGEVNYSAIPSVIYTWPEVAWVGKTEEQVKSEGIEYSVGTFPFMANSRAKAINDHDGFIKIIKRNSDDLILGVHILGPNAGELIAEATLALEYGASSEDIARTCHAHPTMSEALKEACMAAYDKPIHM